MLWIGGTEGKAMLKRVCDKCGKEIADQGYSLVWAENGEGAIGMSPCADLCEECEEEFWKWLKEEETKAAYITP